MSDYEYIDKKTKDGTILGQSTSKLVSFYGIQPVDQPASLTAAVSTLTYTTATTYVTAINCTNVATASGGGCVTTLQFCGLMGALLNLKTRMGELEDRLQEVGLVAGGSVITTTTALPFDFIGTGGGSEGMQIGATTSALLGFWGTTPCDQPAANTTCSAFYELAITATSNWASMDATISIATANAYGLGTAETHNAFGSVIGQVANMQTRLAEMETNLTEVGILPGGTAVTSADGAYDYLDKGCDSGTIFGRDSTALIGFWAATPVDQAAALTTELTAFVFVSSSISATYALGTTKVGTSTFKFMSVTAGNTFLYTVQNCRTRLDEIETALNALGLQAT